MTDEIFENRQEPLLSAVAHGYRDVAQQSVMFGALHRRTTKYLAKLLDSKACQPLEVGIHQRLARRKFWRLGQRSFAVPRAYVLADVAAEYLPTDSRPKLFGNGAAFFDSEVRDALGRVKFVRGGEGVGGAGIEASRARAAAVRGRKVGG